MKRIKIIFSFYLFLITVSSFGQNRSFSIPFDSTFTLPNKIRADKQDLVNYMKQEYRGCGLSNQDGQQVDYLKIIKDYNNIESIATIDLSEFSARYFKERNQNIKIWRAKNANNFIRKITEINSYYKRDTILFDSNYGTNMGVGKDSLIFSDTIIVNSYIILSTKAPYVITFQAGYNPAYNDNKPIYCIDQDCVYMECEVMGLFRELINNTFFQRIDQLVEDGKKYP